MRKGVKNIMNISMDSMYIQCFTTDISKIDFLNTIHDCNIIFTQHIHEGYRDKDYLSTNFVVKNRNSLCKIIFIDTCFFNFYYFDVMHSKLIEKWNLDLYLYHYRELINYYAKGNSAEIFIQNVVDNINYKTKNELEKIAEDSFVEMERRKQEVQLIFINNYKNIHYISIASFVRENYKEKLLFYTNNHPSKFVFHYLAHEIISLLSIPNTINYNLDPLNIDKTLLYLCVQNVVNFNVSLCSPLLFQKTDKKEIIEHFIDLYKQNKILNLEMKKL